MSKLLQHFFYYQNLIKIFHWQTKKYAQHIASDQLYQTLQTLIDQWIEVYQGKYGIIIIENKINISLNNMELSNFKKLLIQFKSFLMNDIPNYLGKDKEMKNTDLINIRDEMLAILNKTLYLITLD
jgi:hypothetical protein